MEKYYKKPVSLLKFGGRKRTLELQTLRLKCLHLTSPLSFIDKTKKKRYTKILIKLLLHHHHLKKMRTVPRLDSSPTDTSPRTIPWVTIPRGALPQRTFPRTNNSPNGHFSDQIFPWPYVLGRYLFFFKSFFLCMY